MEINKIIKEVRIRERDLSPFNRFVKNRGNLIVNSRNDNLSPNNSNQNKKGCHNSLLRNNVKE